MHWGWVDREKSADVEYRNGLGSSLDEGFREDVFFNSASHFFVISSF